MALAMLTPIQFFREAYRAVTDFQFYGTIHDQSLRRSLLYLLYLSAFAAVVMTGVSAWKYLPEITRMMRWAQDNFPVLEVRGGKLQLPPSEPVVKKYEGDLPVTFVFDGSDAFKKPEETRVPVVVFTRDNLVFYQELGTRAFEWKEFGDFRATAAELRKWESLVRLGFVPLAYSLLLVYSLIGKLILAGFLILFGVSATAREAIRLPLSYYYTIAIYSLTPAVVIDLAIALTGLQISYFFAIYLVAAAIYTYLATQRCVALA